MTDEEIKAAYKVIEAREKAVQEVEQSRKNKNEKTYELLKLVNEISPLLLQPPKIIEAKVTDTWQDYDPRDNYIADLDEYLDTLPEGSEVKVTIKVTGPKRQKLFYTCDICGVKFEVGTGRITHTSQFEWQDKKQFLCPEEE